MIRILGAAGCAFIALSAASASAAPRATGICTTLVQGPKVTMTWTGRKTTSRLYYASTAGYTCSSATKYMRRFIGRRSPGLQARISGGPAGFACIALAPKGYTLFQGACKAKARPRVGFVWTLAFG